jgi:uncharacterized protein (TIGR02001 family)
MRGLKAIAAILLLTTGVAHAEVTGTVTVVSDYVFRGITQSAEDPALQGSIDWAHDSGLYVGAWGSCCLDFGSETSEEIDLYAGFAGGEEGGFGYDVGFVYYYYLPDDDDIEYFEIYLGGSYGPFDAKFWYSDDYVNSGESSQYLEANLNYPLPQNFTLLAHFGYNLGDAFDVIDNEYYDYSVGVGYTLGHFDLELKYIDTDIDEGDALFTNDEILNAEDRVFFSVSTTFPWSSE